MGFIADEIIAKGEEPRKAEDLLLTKTASGLATQTAYRALFQSIGVDPSQSHICAHGSGTGSFINATSPVSNHWQTLTCSPQLIELTERLRVEGGWLYRSSKGTLLALTFAPDPR